MCRGGPGGGKSSLSSPAACSTMAMALRGSSFPRAPRKARNTHNEIVRVCVDARIAPFMEATDASRLVCRRGFVSRIYSLTVRLCLRQLRFLSEAGDG